LCPFFWVNPRYLNFKCRRFGTHFLFHLHRSCEQEFTRPTKIEQADCSQTMALKIQIQKKEYKIHNSGEKFETRKVYVVCAFLSLVTIKILRMIHFLIFVATEGGYIIPFIASLQGMYTNAVHSLSMIFVGKLIYVSVCARRYSWM
jgi:hypothetical protein